MTQQWRPHLRKYFELARHHLDAGDAALATFFSIMAIEEAAKVLILKARSLVSQEAEVLARQATDHRQKPFLSRDQPARSERGDWNAPRGSPWRAGEHLLEGRRHASAPHELAVYSVPAKHSAHNAPAEREPVHRNRVRVPSCSRASRTARVRRGLRLRLGLSDGLRCQ